MPAVGVTLCDACASLVTHGDAGMKRVKADGEVVCCHRQRATLWQSSIFHRLKYLQLRHSSYGSRHAFQTGATRDGVLEARPKPLARRRRTGEDI
jgi:hypothetical protein